MADEDQTALREALVDLEGSLERLGLYDVDMHVGTVMGRRVVAMKAMLGDVAFTTRVQAPDLVDLDDELTLQKAQEDRQALERLRQEMRRRAAEGGSFFDDDEPDGGE